MRMRGRRDPEIASPATRTLSPRSAASRSRPVGGSRFGPCRCRSRSGFGTRAALGPRATGLRRVDARTGGPVSVRSTLIQSLLRAASGQLNRLVTRSYRQRYEDQRPAIHAELDELQRTHADDDEARRRATLEVYRTHGMTPSRSCGRAVLLALLGLAPNYLPPLRSERNRRSTTASPASWSSSTEISAGRASSGAPAPSPESDEPRSRWRARSRTATSPRGTSC